MKEKQWAQTAGYRLIWQMGYVVSKEELLPGKNSLKKYNIISQNWTQNVTPVIFTIPTNKTSVAQDLKRVGRDKLSKRRNSRPNRVNIQIKTGSDDLVSTNMWCMCSYTNPDYPRWLSKQSCCNRLDSHTCIKQAINTIWYSPLSMKKKLDT